MDIFNHNANNVHTQHLIEKLTEHFYGSQWNGPLDKSRVQDSITNLLNKATSTVSYAPAFTKQNMWIGQQVEFNPHCSSPTDSTPSSSPVPFDYSSPSESAPVNLDEDCFTFPDQTFLPQLSDLPMELFEKRIAQEMPFDNEDPLFFPMNHYSMAPITAPTSAVRPLSRYSSKEKCPVIPPVQVNSDIPHIKHDTETISIPPPPPRKPSDMAKFVAESVVDFKHVIYNLLVDNFNSPLEHTFVQPITLEVAPGVFKQGFQFNENENPDKRLPELYAQHIRKADLKLENQSSVFIQDLYKFYLRACVELLSKYFVKYDKYTFLYDDTILFVVGGSIEEAEKRISKMGTIQRRQKRNKGEQDFKKSAPKPKRGASVDMSTPSNERKKRARF